MGKSMIFLIIFLVTSPMILCLSISNVSSDSEKRLDKPYFSKLKFALSLLNSLQKNSAGEDIFYSPQSVYRGLLLAYFCAAGKTEEELANLLGLSDWARSKEDAYSRDKNVHVQNETVEYISISNLYVSNRIAIT